MQSNNNSKKNQQEDEEEEWCANERVHRNESKIERIKEKKFNKTKKNQENEVKDR